MKIYVNGLASLPQGWRMHNALRTPPSPQPLSHKGRGALAPLPPRGRGAGGEGARCALCLWM